MKNILVLIISLFFALQSNAQNNDYELAEYYYNEGELEKALPYLQKIYEEDHRDFIFEKLLDCTSQLEGERSSVKLLKQQIEYYPNNINYSVKLGKLYEEFGNDKAAKKLYDDLIENVVPRSYSIIQLSDAFRALNKPERSLEVLIKGRKELQNSYPLHFQFAQIYSDLGRNEDMINEYITLLDYNERMLSTVKNVIPRYIDFESENTADVDLLKRKLLENIQKKPNITSYSDLLIWVFVQEKNFNAAYVQAKALDKRTRGNGKKLMELGDIALNNREFDVARKAFKSVLEQGIKTPYYYNAEYKFLNTSFKEITENKIYDSLQLNETITAYNLTIERIGFNENVVPISLNLAHIQAYYARNSKAALKLLQKTKSIPGLNGKSLAEVKVALADILVLENDIWEASLLYMQVENDFKYETIGYEAKYKNARVFYYSGDFKWAQSQLDVLKASTTKLIANNALELSILITDNLGLDSNYTAMRQFANADLLLAQHKYQEAFIVYDSILKFLPYHGLADEALLRKAEAYQELQDWDKAVEALELICSKHSGDILVDNALIQLGNIYENHFADTVKAKDYYFKIMKEHKGSLFVTEARKRYRKLEEKLTPQL